MNLNAALTLDISRANPNTWALYYHERCEQEGINPCLSLNDYRVFAEEANGNSTLYHHTTGEVLMFAHDHAFEHIEPALNCPEYTFYTINNCPNFRTWVELVAQQWLRHIG